MRLLVRSTTIRAPTHPGTPRIYALGRQGSVGRATCAASDNTSEAYGFQGSTGRAVPLLVRTATQGTRGYAIPLVRALGRQGSTARATAASGSNPVAYAYTRTLVIERMEDLAASTPVDHVEQLYLIDTWLKQSSISGGRIRNANCYDLIFTTSAGVQLDHEIAAYDGTAGRLDFNMRLPSWAISTDQFIFIVRYGADL